MSWLFMIKHFLKKNFLLLSLERIKIVDEE